VILVMIFNDDFGGDFGGAGHVALDAFFWFM